jgi:hypothetical protein
MSGSFLLKVSSIFVLFLFFLSSGCLLDDSCYGISVEILLEEELMNYDLNSFVNITNVDLSKCRPLSNAIDQLIANFTHSSPDDRRIIYDTSQEEWNFARSITNESFIYQQYYFLIAFMIC